MAYPLTSLRVGLPISRRDRFNSNSHPRTDSRASLPEEERKPKSERKRNQHPNRSAVRFTHTLPPKSHRTTNQSPSTNRRYTTVHKADHDRGEQKNNKSNGRKSSATKYTPLNPNPSEEPQKLEHREGHRRQRSKRTSRSKYSRTKITTTTHVLTKTDCENQHQSLTSAAGEIVQDPNIVKIYMPYIYKICRSQFTASFLGGGGRLSRNNKKSGNFAWIFFLLGGCGE